MKGIKKRFQFGNNIIRDTFYSTLFVFVVSSLTTSIGSLIDGVIIGQCLGVDSITAFGIISPLMFVFALIGSIVSSGSRNRFTRIMGEGKIEKARGVFSLACILSVGMAILLMLIVLCFSKPISEMLGARGNAAYILPKAQAYLIGIAIGLPAMNAVRTLSAYMTIDSDKKLTIISTFVMTIANILMDLFVAFVIHGDTLEMGITTSLGYYIAFGVLLLHFRKKDIMLKFSFKNIQWKESFRIIKTGLPVGVCRISNTIRSAIMNNLLAITASAGAVAAYTVHRSADGFLNPITIGMADTVALISGVLLGEQNRPKMKTLLFSSVQATIIITVGISILAFFLAPVFAGLYIKDDPIALEYAIRAVRCYAIGMPFYGLNLIYQNYLQGIGKSVLSSISGFLLEGALLVLSAVIMLPMFKQEAIWLAFPVTQVLMFAYFGIVIFVENRRMKNYKLDLWNRVILLPKTFDVPDEDRLDTTVYNLDEVMNLKEKAWDFCTEKGCDNRRRYVIALCVEELARNVVQHGFKENKKNCIDLRIIKKDENYILRIRDNCVLFNPKKELQLINNEDLTYHMGLRLAFETAEDIQYTSLLKLNNLIIKV